MRRGASREQIIRTTQELIARNGIRAVRVDEIAQSLGISKRTLYEMFSDKTDLVSACLDDMGHRSRQHFAAVQQQSSESALKRARLFFHSIIDGLYAVDSCFLAEIRQKADFAERFSEHRAFCRNELAQILDGCKKAGFLLDEIDTQNLAERILDTQIEMRINHASREEQILFCRTMLRGTATRQGIELIDHGAR